MTSFAIHTLGCKTNQAESDQIIKQLTDYGLQLNSFKEKADIYVINSCTVTQRADKKSLQFIKQAGKNNPRAKIYLTGCYATLTKSLPSAIIIENKKKLVDILKKYGSNTPWPAQSRIRRNLLIQTGCENFCSYCVVPFIRKGNQSKPIQEILKEAHELISEGAKEIVLTGTNIGKHKYLIKIIKEISKIKDLKRIRISSIEPMHITENLIKSIAKNKKVCPHLHIPLQSGSNKILKAMNRNYTCESFAELINMIKKNIPDIALNTDVIAGFPGENENDFQETLDIIKEINFSRLHVFSFSKRPLTKADNMFMQNNISIIKKRSDILKELGRKLMVSFEKKYINKKVEILVESKNKKGQWEGLTPHYLRCSFHSKKDLFGQVVKEKITNFQN